MMNKSKIKKAYEIAEKYAKTKKEAVQVGLQMAINGEVIVEQGKIKEIE